MLAPERRDVLMLPVPTTVTVADADMAEALSRAGWSVYPPGEGPPTEPPIEPPATGAPDAPAMGWPGGVWSGGGRLVAHDSFAGPGLSPLVGSGIKWQTYPGARPGWTKQAESQWNVPGVYDPAALRFADGLELHCEYHPEGAPGPPGNNPAYYWTGAVCSWPAGHLGVSGPGTAPVGFAWQAGATDVILESVLTMSDTVEWTWQGHWLCSGPDWRLELDWFESVGDPPAKGLASTTHYNAAGNGGCNAQQSEGVWGIQPQPGSTHTYTAVVGADASMVVYVDGERRASTPAVPHQSQWMCWIHQFGLASRPRDWHPGWTAEHQALRRFTAWQPTSTPAGQGIKGGGSY
jgi:hypothetical protein